MTLTLTYDEQLSRVRVNADSLTDPTVTVERSPDRINWTTVRGGADLAPSGGAISLDDYEFAANVANFYRVGGQTTMYVDLNDNPYFETDLSGWAAGNATVVRSTEQAHEGVASAKITPNGTSASGGLSATVRKAVTAGQTYRAELWAYSPGGWSDLGPAIDWQDSSGTYLSTSLGGASVPAGVWTQVVRDWQAPANAAFAVMRARHGGTPTSSAVWYADEVRLRSTTSTAQIAPAIGGVWLKSVARPFLNRQVEVRDISEMTRPTRSGVFEVVGRSFPVAVTDVRSSRRWTLYLNARDEDDAKNLDLTLASGDILFLQVPTSGRISVVPSAYISVGDSTETILPTHDLKLRVFALPCVEVAAPGPDVVGATANWQTALNTYPTWADLLAAQPTWADLLELIGSPTDVIVS